MTIPEILKDLELYTGRFPLEAMQAAIQQRDAITPELLRIIEAVAENPVECAKRRDYMAPTFAVFLLAQFRETRAYPAIVKIFSAPGETPFDLMGDVVTEGLSQILASVFDGQVALLKEMVESETVNEFARSSAIHAFLVLENTGQMPREAVVEYLRSLFKGKLARSHSYAWDGLICAIADLPAPELLEEVKWAYKEGLVDPMVADFEGIERDALSTTQPRSGQTLITDAIAEMEWWSSFYSESEMPMEVEPQFDLPQLASGGRPATPAPYVAPKPFIRETKIGRNKPCPCGSGKKYKKCCGGK